MTSKEIIATVKGQIKGLKSFLEGVHPSDSTTVRTAKVELNCLEKLLTIIDTETE